VDDEDEDEDENDEVWAELRPIPARMARIRDANRKAAFVYFMPDKSKIFTLEHDKKNFLLINKHFSLH
jgi:hypothetical protein